jgi:hypothetical protein
MNRELVPSSNTSAGVIPRHHRAVGLHCQQVRHCKDINGERVELFFGYS